jgi:hypothetical protein
MFESTGRLGGRVGCDRQQQRLNHSSAHDEGRNFKAVMNNCIVDGGNMNISRGQDVNFLLVR